MDAVAIVLGLALLATLAASILLWRRLQQAL